MSDNYGYNVCSNYEEVLHDKNIDTVHIMTPHYLHTPIAINALESGKHVLLEKPAGIGFEELKQLKMAELKSEGRISVVLQNRYNNTSAMMKKKIADGNLGELRSVKAIVAWHRDDEYYDNSSWRGKWETEGGGLLINQAVHTIDLMRYIGGEIESVEGRVDNLFHKTIEVEDTAMAAFYYKNGAIGNFYATNNHAINSKIELEFVYENGILRMLDDKLFYTNKKETKVIAEDIILEGKKSYWGVSHDSYIKAFYESLAKGEEFDVKLEDAIISNKMVLGIYESSKKNKKYYLTEG